MHAAQQGHKIAFCDSDIVILALRFFATLGFSELWVGFGSRKNYRDIPIHQISSDLGMSAPLALPLFHMM